ncbi:hypothetical protein ADL22_12335 [Streptomyces sp. NRRL F-4489]|nr:hypothetical protein ADL22_12335 [Streptomyces sp. NRRL F-4489]
MQAVQDTLWNPSEPADTQSTKGLARPVEDWGVNDLVNHWTRCISRARWADHLIGHTNRGGLGKTFREAFDAGHGPAALKASIDQFFANPRYHTAKRPWTLYRAVINDLLAQAAPPPRADPWATAEQLDIPREITENWGGYHPTTPDPWAAAVRR